MIFEEMVIFSIYLYMWQREAIVASEKKNI